jgi:hypothetical protein
MKVENLKGKLIHGSILGLSAYMGVKGFKQGCKLFEEAVPAAIEKVHMVGLVADLEKEAKKNKKKK